MSVESGRTRSAVQQQETVSFVQQNQKKSRQRSLPGQEGFVAFHFFMLPAPVGHIEFFLSLNSGLLKTVVSDF